MIEKSVAKIEHCEGLRNSIFSPAENNGEKVEADRDDTILDLPSDTLLQIIGQLDQNDLSSLSLVSKRLRSLTDQLVRRLTFPKLPLRNFTFQKLFSRFSSVNHIVLRCVRIPRILSAILSPPLKIEHLEIQGRPTGGCPSRYEKQRMLSTCGNFKKIKALSLGSCLFMVGDDDLAQFFHNYPSLQEVDLSGRTWTNVQIHKLTSKVPNLRKISLYCCDTLTYHALRALSANCIKLEEICFQGWTKITPQGFCTFLPTELNLRSLKLPNFYPLVMQPELPLLGEAISTCVNISHLSIKKGMVNDDILRAIANSRARSTSLSMDPYNGTVYTMRGVSAMLRAFQGLTRLRIGLPVADLDKQDTRMSQLVKSLPCLKDINVTSQCPMYAMLFSLTENCPLLECIRLRVSNNDPANHHDVCVPERMKMNYSIKHIDLHPDPDKLLKKHLKSICASVKNLN